MDQLQANRGTVLALGAASVALWAFFITMALGLGGPVVGTFSRLMMPMTAAWSPASVAAVFFMWAVMMAAMMLPSAVPMVLAYRTLDRHRDRGPGSAHATAFAAAYLLVWAAFSLAATVLQWWLQAVGLVSAMGASTTPWFAGGLLLAAGTVQVTPLKQACLRKCRTPIGFLTINWRDGAGGAAELGLRHGVFCLGCCWALMLLPFVAGTMNLLWMAVLTGVVTAEKVLPHGETLSRAIGLALAAAGMALLYAAWRGAVF